MARVVKNVPIEFRRDSLHRLRLDWENFAGVINEFLLGNWSTAAEGFRATSQLFLRRRRVYMSALCLYWCAKSHRAEGNEDQAVEASAEAVCRFISVGAYEYALDCLELFASVNYKPITNEKLAKSVHQIAVTAYYFSDLDRMNRALSFASEPQRTKWLPVLNRFCAIAAEFSMENIVKRFNDTAESDGIIGIGDRLLEKSTKAMVEISHLTRELHSVGFVPPDAGPVRLGCEHGNNLAASNLEAALAWSQTLNWNVAPKIALVFELTVLESLSRNLTLGYMSQQGAAVKTLIERSKEIAYQTGKLDRRTKNEAQRLAQVSDATEASASTEVNGMEGRSEMVGLLVCQTDRSNTFTLSIVNGETMLVFSPITFG